MKTSRAMRSIPICWGIAVFLLLAALSRGPGISREEAGVLAAAGAVPAAAGARPERPPLAALLSRAGETAALWLGLPHRVGYRLGSALAAGLLAALLAILAGELAGPAAAALAPALLVAPPRLLLPILQAGPRAAGAALVLAALLAYRRAARATGRPARLAAALAGGALFGLALAFQLESAQLLAVLAVHAALVPALLALRPRPEPGSDPEPGTEGWDIRGPTPPEPRLAPRPSDPPAPNHSLRWSLLALAAMAVIGPALALGVWPWLWTDTLHRAGAALAAATLQAPVLHLGRLIEAGRPPPGYPLLVTALALPAALAVAFAAGLLHGLWRLWRAVRGIPGLADELLLLLAAAGPLVAAQLGLSARIPGPGPWLAAFPFLAALAARAILDCAAALWRSRARYVAACLAAAALAPAVAASIRAYPQLGSAWGELAGGAPGAATLGLARHDGEAAATLLGEISDRARPGARVHFGSIPAAALAIYAADGLLRPDLATVASPGEADVAVVPVAGRPRDDEYRVWAALRTSTPVAGVFLDEVPLAWVYARPGAWR